MSLYIVYVYVRVSPFETRTSILGREDKDRRIVLILKCKQSLHIYVVYTWKVTFFRPLGRFGDVTTAKRRLHKMCYAIS